MNDVLQFGNCPLGSGVAIISYTVMNLWDDTTFLNLLNSIDFISVTQVKREWENELSCHCRKSSFMAKDLSLTR